MPHLVLSGQISQKKKIIEYIANLEKALGINRMWSKVIFLNFKTEVDGSYGDCWGDSKDGYVEINVARKLEGKKIPFEEIMSTVAHEMVHAKQYLRNELNGYSTTWKGRNAAGYKYENQPWEREALRLETKLYQECWPQQCYIYVTVV